MKRLGFILIILTIFCSFAFAQVGDARTRGMANAFTAVADDINAIYFNPAGLAYLDRGYLTVGVDLSAVLSKRLAFGQEEYPYPWENWDDNGASYYYWDEFLNTDVFFDPSEYGFPYDADLEGDYERAVQEYFEWRDFYGFYEFNQNVSDLNLFPRIAYATKNWGVSAITETSIDMVASEYRGADTELSFNLNKDVGLIAAYGMNFGPVAAGANLKYYVRKTDVVTFSAAETQDGPPEDFFSDILLGTENEEEGSSHIELGVGGLVKFGNLSAGAYIDNLLYFLPDEDVTDDTEVDLLGIFDSLSIGASFKPIRSRFLNLIASVDIKNIGSDTDRMLTAGAEAGLNILDIIVANGRLGYRQDLPGDLLSMIDTFDPRDGFYTIGMGGKFIFGSIDIAVEFPADMIFDPPSGNIPEEQLDTPFMNFVINMSLVF